MGRCLRPIRQYHWLVEEKGRPGKP